MLDIMAIPLTQGLFALVDGENYEFLNQWKWYANRKGKTFYAARMTKMMGFRSRQKQIYMHRLILNPPDGFESDHINHCGLDNRKKNLRICTRRQNIHNQRTMKQKQTSQYKGVFWRKKLNQWEADITISKKQIYLGRFKSEIEAARKYDIKAKELFGEFANTNF